MGWKPWEIRAATLHDFDAAFRGWRKAQGHDDGPDTSDEALADLEALMERYPDE